MMPSLRAGLCAVLISAPILAQHEEAWRAFAEAVATAKADNGPAASQKQSVAAAVERMAALTEEQRRSLDYERLVESLGSRANILREHDLAWSLLSDIERRLAAAGDAEPDLEGRRQYCSFLLGQVCLNRGDFEQARRRLTEAEPVLVRGQPADARNVLILRHDIATTALQQRDYPTAVRYYEMIVAATRHLQDLPFVESLSRLGYAKHFAGDRMGSFTAYEERLALILKLLPADDLEVARARQNLGTAMMNLGDYRGAYEQNERSLEILAKRSPPDDAAMLGRMVGQSKLLLQFDDEARSESVIREVIARLQAVPPPLLDEQQAILAEARLHLAQIFAGRGDDEEGWREASLALEYYAATRKNGNRDVGKCELILGACAQGLGRVAEARTLLEQAVDHLTESLPFEDNTVQVACSQLVSLHRLCGDLDRAIALAERLLGAAKASIDDARLAARPLARLARLQQRGVHECLSLASILEEGEARARLVEGVLFVSQMLRGIETRIARATSRVRRDHRAQTRGVEAELVAVADRIQSLSQGTREIDAQQKLVLDDLVRDKERLQGQLTVLAQEVAPLVVPSTAAIVAALPPRCAAVATIRYEHEQVVDAAKGVIDRREWLAAIVLQPGRPPRLVDMGNLHELAQRIHDDDIDLKVLRAALLDPFLEGLEGCDAVYLALDELLKTVSLDALPLPSGEPIGTAIELRQVESLFDLVETWPALPEDGVGLVAVGGLDYQGADVDGRAAAALPLEGGVAPPELLRGREGGFAALPGTAQEVAEISAAFAKRYPTGTVTRFSGRAATKESLRDALRGARFVHFATHGFGAISSTAADATEPSATVADLTGFALCGLALSGANLPPDAAGGLPGILLGEELLQFDLADCHLAVLSVCDSANGALSYGQGFSSLHRALHAAGARFVVSTMWPIGDKAASFLMREFYRELLLDPEHPHRALWKAKMRGRSAGLMDDDWAAFRLTGC